MHMSFLVKYHGPMCTAIHADVNMNIGGLAKVKSEDNSTKLYTENTGLPIVKLLIFWHFICFIIMWHKRFYENERT